LLEETTVASNGKSNGRLYRIRNSKIQGRGAFAVRRIRKGQRIVEYIGERIHPSEETNRYDDESMSRHHTFLFAVDENVTIDAGRIGNDAKYINHSCDPNCEAVNDDGRIFIFAVKNIQPGCELAYDYAYEPDGRITKKMLEIYPCYCGTKKCRGTILDIKIKKRKKPNRKRSSGTKSSR